MRSTSPDIGTAITLADDTLFTAQQRLQEVYTLLDHQENIV